MAWWCRMSEHAVSMIDIARMLDKMDAGHVIIYKRQGRLNVVSLPIPLPYGQVTAFMQDDSIVRVTQTTSWKPDTITFTASAGTASHVEFTGWQTENGT
jgi:hypothetical protein|tara:strand:+ start:6041 stop:6337 length:297 start_codon:yes stop_codon:yes gene_type:complete